MLEAELTEQLYLSICLLYLMIYTYIYILSLSDQVVQDKARLFINDQSELISLIPGNRTTQPAPLQSGPVGVKTQPWRQAPIHLPHLNTEPPMCPAGCSSRQPITKSLRNYSALNPRIVDRIEGAWFWYVSSGELQLLQVMT